MGSNLVTKLINSKEMKKLIIVFLFIVSYLNINAQTAFSVEIRGVHDGDSYLVRPINTISDSNFYVRIIGCDAPEVLSPYRQEEPFGVEAGNFMRNTFKGKPATLVVYGKDKYGRVLGQLFVNDIDISMFILQKGYAKYATSRKLNAATRKAYIKARDKAKKAKLGIWSTK